jgi:hypothetical protein
VPSLTSGSADGARLGVITDLAGVLEAELQVRPRKRGTRKARTIACRTTSTHRWRRRRASCSSTRIWAGHVKDSFYVDLSLLGIVNGAVANGTAVDLSGCLAQ